MTKNLFFQRSLLISFFSKSIWYNLPEFERKIDFFNITIIIIQRVFLFFPGLFYPEVQCRKYQAPLLFLWSLLW